MPTSTYTPIASNVLTSATSTVTFSSIPSTYTDLRLVANLNGSSGSISFKATVNGDTGTNYSSTLLYGTGTSALTARNTNANDFLGGYAMTQITQTSLFAFDFMNYANTTTYKSVLSRIADNNTGLVLAYVGLWRNTSAINSITINGATSNFSIGCSFTLFGIKAGS